MAGSSRVLIHPHIKNHQHLLTNFGTPLKDLLNPCCRGPSTKRHSTGEISGLPLRSRTSPLLDFSSGDSNLLKIAENHILRCYLWCHQRRFTGKNHREIWDMPYKIQKCKHRTIAGGIFQQSNYGWLYQRVHRNWLQWLQENPVDPWPWKATWDSKDYHSEGWKPSSFSKPSFWLVQSLHLQHPKNNILWCSSAHFGRLWFWICIYIYSVYIYRQTFSVWVKLQDTCKHRWSSTKQSHAMCGFERL